jgi:ATP-dependent DNA helicase RecG
MDTERLLDNPPRSRNEALASFMRRAGICEERGSGVDKVVWETEIAQLPAPEFRVVGDNMTSTLFAAKALNDMEKADRIRAVYLHACLRWVNRQDVANTSIRGRFGIETQNAARATRLINEALEAGMIVPKDAAAGRKYMQYVPFWAGTTTRI